MILGVYIAVNVLMVVLLLWSRRAVARFLEETPALQSEGDLDRYKAMVRRQMYGALFLGLPMCLGALGLACYIGWTQWLGGLPVVLGVSVSIVLLARSNKALEVKVKTLPTAAPLAAEYARVSAAWSKQMLPSF